MPFYQRIRDLREDADRTQSDVAEYLGTTAQYYGKYEKGERELPFSRAILLADYYNVSLDYLAGRRGAGERASAPDLSEDESKILELFRFLTERNKGKAELFLEQLAKSQTDRSDGNHSQS